MWGSVRSVKCSRNNVPTDPVPENDPLLKWLRQRAVFKTLSYYPSPQPPDYWAFNFVVQVRRAPMTPAGRVECRPRGNGSAWVLLLLLLPAPPHTVHSWTGTRLMLFVGPALNKSSMMLQRRMGLLWLNRRGSERQHLNVTADLCPRVQGGGHCWLIRNHRTSSLFLRWQRLVSSSVGLVPWSLESQRHPLINLDRSLIFRSGASDIIP